MADRLFIYGTLAPGRPDEHVLADVDGWWEPASVRGHLHEQGWGAALGHPGIILAEDGPEVHGAVLTAGSLADQWERRSEERRVGKSVDPGGRRTMRKEKKGSASLWRESRVK